MSTRIANLLSTTFALACAFAATLAAESPHVAPVRETGTKKISYLQQVQPIFQAHCAKCHLNGNKKGGLSLETRESILKGGESGPIAEPHKSDESSLITLLTIDDPDSRMPKKAPPLPAEKIEVLRQWVTQGMPFDGAVTTTAYKSPLSPRAVKLPEVAGLSNPIDRILGSYLTKHEVPIAAVVDDRLFARRVYQDVIGLPPSPRDVAALQSDQSPDKREELVNKLLADKSRYAENWLSFWNDALRNDYEGPGYIDGGRQQITPWLYDALETNKPYDQFVRELIAPPNPASEGFVKGILWRGAVSASQIRELQAAQNMSQVFLGINMKCASCHDSFVSEWKLSDAYGLAGVFAEKPLAMYRCEKDLGKIAPIKFLYPELGKIDAKAPRDKRQQQLATLMTTEKNGRFTRTIVNRLWSKLMGRGIVEPVDEMDHEPWSADLLDWLANDLAANKYDLKKTLATIMTSRAYQMPAAAMKERDDHYTFRGPVVRRLSAEQFYDSLSTLTGIWQEKPAPKALECRPLQLPARWIWSTPNASVNAAEETIYLRKTIELPSIPEEALATIDCDNGYELFVNGKSVSRGDDFTKPRVVDLTKHLVPGKNVFAVIAQNFKPDLSKPTKRNRKGTTKATSKPVMPKMPNPAGLLFLGSARVVSNGQSNLINFDSDSSWKVSPDEVDAWTSPAFDDTSWKPAADLGPIEMGPWGFTQKLAGVKNKFTLRYDRLRAVWARSDALMNALGRPNRERVVTHRDSPATMLQLLELTNGATITRIVSEGGKRWTAAGSPDEIITQIYLKALNRRPTDKELNLARSLIDTPTKPEGVADVLWSITMLPEFQLIY